MTEPPAFSNPYEFDLLMLEPVHAMMATGIRIDQAEKKRLQEQAITSWDETQTLLNQITSRYLNVSSGKQVNSLIYDELGMPRKYKRGVRGKAKRLTSDEAALRAIMAVCKNKVDTLTRDDSKDRWREGYIVCHQILKIRGLRKQISSYLGLSIDKGELAGPTKFEDEDGRIRGTISVGGTETARFTHSKTLWGTGINLATVPRKLRSMFIPDEGYEFAEFDLNRGESWIYAHLSEDPELLRIHTEGLDFHAETASTISEAFGDYLTVDWIVEHKNNGSYKIRYVGKKVNHATSYRMKPFTGAESVNAEAEDTGVTVTVAQFREARELWLEKYFMIENAWWPEIEATLSDTRTMVTPYGRIHQFHDAWGESLFKAATAYVPQSTSVDYLNRGYLKVYHKLEVPGLLRVLAQTHDSILTMYKIEHRDEVIEQVLDILPSSLHIKGREFTIPVEAQYGKSWLDMTDY
ncbi:MAG: DNA polymerase [Nitrososphaerales archaeon]